MPRRVNTTHRTRYSWPSLVGLLAVAVLIVGLRGSRAEVEISIVDSTEALDTDFSGVYGYYRSSRLADAPDITNPDNITGDSPQEYFEGWAVGKNLSAATTDPEKGLIYRFNGSSWKRVEVPKRCQAPDTLLGPACQSTIPDCTAPQTCGTLSSQELHAIAGQYDLGAGTSELWMVGDNGRVMHTINSEAADAESESANEIGLGTLYRNTACVVQFPLDTNNGPISVPPPGPLYSIGVGTGFHSGGLIGGQNGALYLKKYYKGYGKTCREGTNVGNACTVDIDCNNPVINGSCQSAVDGWQRQCPTFAVAGEHVTGIAYADNRVRYVVTTSGPADLTAIRNCPNGSKGRLYRYDSTVDNKGQLTLLSPDNNNCFFGITAKTTNTPGPNGSRLLNTLWIATSTGVFRYTETNPATAAGNYVGPLAGTNISKKLYSVSSSKVYGGSNINLLQNGGFEAWSAASPSNPNVSPDDWHIYEGYGKNTGSTNSDVLINTGTCGTNTRDLMVASAATAHTEGSYALKVHPSYHFTDTSKCSPVEQIGERKGNFTAGATKNVDLTNVDAAKFRITGKYRVEFTGPTSPTATHAEGGIGLGCPGTIGETRYSPDCSFSYRGGIRTRLQGNTIGFAEFSVVISNQNSQYNERIKGVAGNPKGTGRGMVLQVSCEATYGARVWCDDIKVEPINEPRNTGFQRIQVTAVGQDGVVVRNDNALTNASGDPLSSDTFTRETNPAEGAGKDLMSVSHGLGSYLYAVGKNVGNSNLLLQRGPSNFNGYLWLGNSSPASSGTNGGAGWLSTSCVNDRDSQGRTLCQRSPIGYGLNYESDGTVMRLSGRAWLGKSVVSGSNNDNETLDLGKCLNPILTSATAAQPYNVAGTCLLTGANARTCSGNTQKACTRDFDCYGRCAKDAGFICLYDSDCQIGATVPAPANIPTGSDLKTTPSFRLQCSQSGSSLNSCVGGSWLSFNPTDFIGAPPGSINTCAGGGACLDAALCPNGLACKIKGVGQFLTPANTNDPNGVAGRGWVSLRGAASNPTAALIPQLRNPATQTTPSSITINAPRLYACKSCVPNAATSLPFENEKNDLLCGFCQDNLGQSCAPLAGSSRCYYYCDGVPTNPTCSTDNDCVSVSPTSTCRQSGRCSQNGSTICTTNAECGTGYCAFGALCQAAGANSCNQYAINYDEKTKTFSGFAWSSDYGWIDARYSRVGTSRFIQTRLGDVYSQKRIGSDATQPAPACNATYVVGAGLSITNFCSSLAENPAVSNRTLYKQIGQFIPLSSQENLYTSALGRFDLTGMEKDANSGTPDVNKYGDSIYVLESQNQTIGVTTYRSISVDPLFNLKDLTYYTAANRALGSGVYIAGNATTLNQTYLINRELNFHNGSESFGRGNGLVIVNGNLRIDSNLNYDAGAGGPLQDPRYLASVFVVVRGDLIIDTKVTDLVGAYYVTGTICTVPRGSYTGPGLDTTECLDTRIGTSANTNPLTVRGLMIAKKFVFGRRFAGVADDPRPSELFIYDGRVQTNPMPGMADFAGSLPVEVGTGQ